jgi:hypothetical protein
MIDDLCDLSLEALLKLNRYPGGRGQCQRMAIVGLNFTHMAALESAGYATSTSGGSNRQPIYTITERGETLVRNFVALARQEGVKA